MKKIFCLINIFTIMLFICLANAYFSPLKADTLYNPSAILDVLICPFPVNSNLSTCPLCHVGVTSLGYKTINSLTLNRAVSHECRVFYAKNFNNIKPGSNILSKRKLKKIKPLIVDLPVSAVIKAPNLRCQALCSNTVIDYTIKPNLRLK